MIDIGIEPTIHLGPITIAWHGLTIALGILIGGLMAGAEARARGLDPAPLQTMGIILIVGALVGSRAYYLAEHGGLANPEAWVGNRGFTFYGGFIVVALCLGGYVWWRLDGPATTFFLGVRNSHPDADVPIHDVAYHSGGLYETLIGLTSFAIAMAFRARLRDRPTAMIWARDGAVRRRALRRVLRAIGFGDDRARVRDRPVDEPRAALGRRGRRLGDVATPPSHGPLTQGALAGFGAVHDGSFASGVKRGAASAGRRSDGDPHRRRRALGRAAE